ncbi:MAG: glycoside hydrolase family 127 protein [Clostridia bacterium]|nr:glycoside hydrolase family 127 protein [Clostridia bacterium]
MKQFSFEKVDLCGGFLYGKQKLNRDVTIHAVYDRFYETGRVGAFNFDYKEGDEIKPHIFWDSDVAKWIESAAYIIRKNCSPALEAKIDALVEKIEKNQGADGYFNIYYTVCAPSERWSNRDKHELYCAGHLMEAAVAYAEATGKTALLDCMEKYADYIARVFVEEKSAAFATPGHEEIELALVRMYRHTGKKKFLDLALYFINTRGTEADVERNPYNQSHAPVREQKEAVGHAVRAMYLYTGMAYLAAETGDETLKAACKTLWDDVTRRKMYVTGGIGSTYVGEAFTNAYDLPNDTAYTETCASIGLVFFAQAMLALENDARYADVIERALYNGILSGLSLDGASFFYENPLEINFLEHIPETKYGKRKFPITQRVKCFRCSCCPPNVTRLLATLGGYVFGMEGDTLYLNQYADSTLSSGGVTCTVKTEYPLCGTVNVTASGAKRIALRIPSWCTAFTLSKPYTVENGYAVVENDGTPVTLTLDMTPHAVYPTAKLLRDAHQIAVVRGPIVYCAEAVDNGADLHAVRVPADFKAEERFDEDFGLPVLTLDAVRTLPLDDGALYANSAPDTAPTRLTLIPYHAFANRGDSDMRVWLYAL